MAILLAAGCSSAPPHTGALTTTRAVAHPGSGAPFDASWVGIYASPAEIGGFSGTVLAILGDRASHGLSYRMTYYTDVGNADQITEPEKNGQVLTDREHLYLPEAYGFIHEGRPSLSASITRYTRARINGHKVLLRDDALREFREHNRLYDYGVLIKSSDRVPLLLDLKQVRHESIKVLYEHPNAPWRDPFVYRPNAR